ncbi:MAG: hypothetical protein H7Z77_02470 [Chitinophagaceae bacterium]|nr:hypothetical protein [Polaromonas sp.]
MTTLLRFLGLLLGWHDNHFMMLVKNPVSRSILSALSCQILTVCLRASEKAANPKAFVLHIAV